MFYFYFKIYVCVCVGLSVCLSVCVTKSNVTKAGPKLLMFYASPS